MPKFDKPLKMTSVVLNEENPEGLDQALRILAHLAVKKYLREHTQVTPPSPPAAAPTPTLATESKELEGRKLLDVDGLSRYLSMPKATIYTWVSSHKLPPETIVRLGRSLRFDRVEVDRWVESNRGGR